MKKSTLLISSLVLSTLLVFGQNARKAKTTQMNENDVQSIIQNTTRTPSGHIRCLTTEMEQLRRLSDPTVKSPEEMKAWIDQIVKANQNNPSTQKASRNIPVVVHVLHNGDAIGSGENISVAQINSQITVLNLDFSATNSDYANTPAAFNAVKGNMDIQFCLAQTDPSGNSTTGIDRVNTGVASYTTGTIEAAKPATQWDPTKYFNIWVCNLGGGILGYAQFPNSGAANTDGVVIGYNYFGNTGAVSAPYNKGRTATHEIGHCLGLYHIWGDDGTACTGSDAIADTPNQADENYGCPNFATNTSCSNAGDMAMNYMDYTDDACMYMFTNGQKAVTDAVLASAPRRASLLTSTVCNAPSTSSDDAGISIITSPTGSICSGTINPVVVIKNYGTSTLISAKINYTIDAAVQPQYTWSGSLATNATAIVNLPAATVAAGAHTFNANTTLPNGVADGTPSNNAATQTNFTIITGGAALPYSQGFEGTYLPTNWVASNPDGLTTWAKTTVAAKTGTGSVFMDYFNYNATPGEIDDITAPALNLSTNSNPQLTFQLAYSMYTNPTSVPPYSDTLTVLVSTNCGVSWTEVYRKSSAALATATPNYTTAQFVPTAAQWRKETISLTPYASSTNAMIKFRGLCNYENQLYIDDINVDFAVGIDNISNNTDINIFPNPAIDHINVFLTNINKAKIEVYNVLGSLVYNDVVLSTINKIDMSNQPNGVYLVKVTSDGVVTTKKVLLSK